MVYRIVLKLTISVCVFLTSHPICIMAKKMYISCTVTSGSHEHLLSLWSASKY